MKSDNYHTNYDLVVEGNDYGKFHGSLFLHKEKLRLKRPHVDILLETEQQVYKQGQTSECSQKTSELCDQKRLLRQCKIRLIFYLTLASSGPYGPFLAIQRAFYIR